MLTNFSEMLVFLTALRTLNFILPIFPMLKDGFMVVLTSMTETPKKWMLVFDIWPRSRCIPPMNLTSSEELLLKSITSNVIDVVFEALYDSYGVCHNKQMVLLNEEWDSQECLLLISCEADPMEKLRMPFPVSSMYPTLL